MTSNKQAVLILDNIRSVHNVGAIFRTADTCGISRIFLTGLTPAPIDRFGRLRKDIAKTALGAEKNVSWQSEKSIIILLNKLKKQGFQIIAVEQAQNSIDYKRVKVKAKTAFVFGNEVNGLPQKVLDLCDVVAEIPMKGKKESLNVSVATGVALFRILDK